MGHEMRNAVPAVSVLMAAYNVARYIDAAIQSVLAQRGVSFELLIGDDASTDATWTRIQRYTMDPFVRAWRFRRHRGPGAVRNRLLAHARAPYLSICDADDVMLPGNLKALIKVCERDRRVGVVCGETMVTDVAGRGPMRQEIEPRGPEEGWDLVSGIVGYRHGNLLRRALVLEVGGYREDLPVAEDYELLLRLAERTRFVALRGRALYGWRRHPGSLMHQTPQTVLLSCMNAIRRVTIRRRYGYEVPW